VGRVAIEVRDVSKRFRINLDRHSSLKDRFVSLGRRKRGTREFWALRHIDFEVEEGETLALLGPNGSGKSTLLKCIGGILRPTQGEIRVRGRIASLLELGAGFHPDLTGKENVFLNASILGLAKRDVERRLDDIVAFAELEEFINEPVKHYSSGMYVRLGFAVAINVDPDILLVDEVLAVGDEAFQQKCLTKIGEFQEEGRTIVFVSHVLDLVRQISQRAVVLDQGAQIEVGPPTHAIRTFRRRLLGVGVSPPEIDAGARPPDGDEVEITDVTLSHADSDARAHLEPDDALQIRVAYRAPQPVDAVFWLAIHDDSPERTLVYACNSAVLDGGPTRLDGEGRLTFCFDQLPLLSGNYLVSVGVHDPDVTYTYDRADNVATFEVITVQRSIGIVNLDARVHLEADAQWVAVDDSETRSAGRAEG
jgi:ABC-2 type transport system ATP-binding protein